MNLSRFSNLGVKKKIIALFTGLAVFIFLVFQFVIMPTIHNIEYFKEQIIKQEVDLEVSLARDRNKGDLEKRIRQIEPQIDEMKKLIVNSNRELEFITSMEAIGNENNIALQMNLISPDKAKKSNAIPVEFLAVGSYADVMRYLSDLESSSYYLEIKSLELSSGANQINKGSVLPVQGENSAPSASLKPVTLKIVANSFWE